MHDYQLLSKDMKALGAADAFVINGAGMEGFLEKVIEQLPLSLIHISGVFPKLGIHADGRKARDGVRLVEKHRAI